MTTPAPGRSLALPGARTPLVSLVLGYAPMAALPLLAVASTAVPPLWAYNVILAGHVWAAAILIFISGVRRGLSFGEEQRGETGPLAAEIAAALGYFAIGLVAILLRVQFALLILMLGYALVGVLDRRAARARRAPRYFARLRPLQALIAIAGLAGLLARLLTI